MVEADSPAGVLAEQRDQRLLEVAVDTPLRTAIPIAGLPTLPCSQKYLWYDKGELVKRQGNRSSIVR
jgi:hypothetical protein